ncbi:MAG: AI-2E family transporter [Candidatus Moranbacteria bacterium]|nr:AI-2E family transporter [Candidatus Moranbacteria bacterium]
MQARSLNVAFFFLLLFGVGITVFFIFQPFITAIIAAAILTTLLKRPYHYFEKVFHGHKISSALLTCLMAIFVVVTPLFIVVSLAINEVNTLYSHVENQGSLQSLLNNAFSRAEGTPGLRFLVNKETFSEEKMLSDISNFSSNAVGFLQTAYQSITGFVLWIFILFFTLFYFLIDGKKALRYMMDLSPLKDEHDKLLVQKFVSMSRATLKGNLVIGIIQGLLGGLAFAIAGVPSPAIWGIIMVFFSIIPMVGTGIIWLPAGLILLLLGDVWQGVFVLAFGALVISSVDNILRPKLVGKDTQMHPLMIFFATIGGIYFFGLPGFIMGPIVVSLFVALGEIYRIEFQAQLKEYNHPK